MNWLIVLIAVIGSSVFLGFFFWVWWSLPRVLVQPHFDKDQLERLTLQDRLRQTNLQILLAVGGTALVALFIIQLWLSTHQWESEFDLRTAQQRITQFADSMKLLESDDAPSIAGISTLRVLTAGP